MNQSKSKFSKKGLQKLIGIFSYILPYKWKFITGLMFLFVSSGAFMVFPLIAGKLVDIATGQRWWVLENIEQTAILLIVVLLILSIASFFRVILFTHVVEKAIANIRQALYQRILTLPMGFFDQTRSGDLISRLSSDVSLVQSAMSTTLAELIRQLLILLGGTVIIFFVTPSLSLFMLGTLPLIIIVGFVFGKRIRKLSRKSQDYLADTNVIAEETIQSIQSVKSYTSETFEMGRYDHSMKSAVVSAIKVGNFRAMFIAFIIFAVFGAIVSIMWYGASLVQSGDMSVGDLISFILYTTFIGASIAGLGDLFGQLQKAMGAAERILEIHEEEAEVITASTRKISGDISFTHVHFQYPTRPDMPVLKGIDLAIPEGKKVALVGHSGAGKSTITQLLMRFYDISDQGGEISIGHQRLQDFGLSELRANIGIVPQEVILFGGSIAENIRYGKPEASEEEVASAAAKANALEFIQSFPEGMQTLVGERGVKLSGGQRQRIAIARAILKDPSILILDEATSALDSKSESLIQEALGELMKDRTTLIIAHRLSTIKQSDVIYVLEEGEVKESGTHDVLMSQSGAYANFVKLQTIAQD